MPVFSSAAAACAAVFVLAVTAPVASAASFTVNSTAHPGTGVCDATECTLREAISAANATTDPDTITFSIGTGVQTIVPSAPLPGVSQPVTIDGTTQPGFAGKPIIQLNGIFAGSGAVGLHLYGGGSTVRGLVINRFSQTGITITGPGGNTVAGNYVGTNVAGTIARGNGAGVTIYDSPDNLIGGSGASARNVISGNDHGVTISASGASENRIVGNYIGTDASATAAVGNAYEGVFISSAGRANSVGSNVISGNWGSGIDVYFFAGNGQSITIGANRIGTNRSGADLGNSGSGISLDGASWVDVYANTIAFNSYSGVSVRRGSSVRITQNSIYRNNDGSLWGLVIDL